MVKIQTNESGQARARTQWLVTHIRPNLAREGAYAQMICALASACLREVAQGRLQCLRVATKLSTGRTRRRPGLPEIVSTVLLLFCLLQIKHMFADFFLQTPRMLSGRGAYLHMGRAQHAGVHMVLSALVFGMIGASPGFILPLVLAEWVVHFHLDWGKARFSEVNALMPTQARFWQAMGADQALHQLTYIAMVWAWVQYGVS